MTIARAAAAVVALAAAAGASSAQGPAGSAAPPPTSQSIIDFEDFTDLGFGVGPRLGERYWESHGVRFGLGANAAVCAASSPEDAAARGFLCPYPRGASGDTVGYFDQSADELEIGFDRAPMSVAIAINPTGGALGGAYEIVITGFGADGAALGQSRRQAVWGEDAIAWPTRASFSADGAPIARILVSISRGRFFFDDLTLEFAPPPSPVSALVAAAPAEPLAGYEPVDNGAAAAAAAGYRAVERVRTRIDWDAAFAALDAQAAAGVVPPVPSGRDERDAAALPVLVPAISGALFDLWSGGDSYFAALRSPAGDWTVFGTRVMAVVDDAAAAGENVRYETLPFGAGARFSMFGASYFVVRHCAEGESETECADPSGLAPGLTNLTLAIGETGRGRP